MGFSQRYSPREFPRASTPAHSSSDGRAQGLSIGHHEGGQGQPTRLDQVEVWSAS
jgi:hypothetical protein